jgi:arsenate reductase
MQRVLFVCIGNSCRSQMAEAFARTYGTDVILPASAGLAPALTVAPDTIRAMKEKNIAMEDHFPKSLQQLRSVPFDIIVNISGTDLSDLAAPVRDWEVRDPIGMKYEAHCEIRDQIEMLVMELILDLRRSAAHSASSS